MRDISEASIYQGELRPPSPLPSTATLHSSTNQNLTLFRRVHDPQALHQNRLLRLLRDPLSRRPCPLAHRQAKPCPSSPCPLQGREEGQPCGTGGRGRQGGSGCCDPDLNDSTPQLMMEGVEERLGCSRDVTCTLNLFVLHFCQR